MSGDLTIRKRALTPIKSLIYGLRRYDQERSAAVQGGGKEAVGYMSTMTKIYLADIYDHIDFILASLDMYSAMTENLIRFSFDVSCDLFEYCTRRTNPRRRFADVDLLSQRRHAPAHHSHSHLLTLDIANWLFCMSLLSYPRYSSNTCSSAHIPPGHELQSHARSERPQRHAILADCPPSHSGACPHLPLGRYPKAPPLLEEAHGRKRCPQGAFKKG